jgi:hypothetical protein
MSEPDDYASAFAATTPPPAAAALARGNRLSRSGVSQPETTGDRSDSARRAAVSALRPLDTSTARAAAAVAAMTPGRRTAELTLAGSGRRASGDLRRLRRCVRFACARCGSAPFQDVTLLISTGPAPTARHRTGRSTPRQGSYRPCRVMSLCVTWVGERGVWIDPCYGPTVRPFN